jgi:hypothetical protein
MADHEQKHDDVEEPDEAASIKELTDDELSDVAGGSAPHNMGQHLGSGT